VRIEEAINRIDIFLNDVSEGAPELLDDALKLGIEALKAWKEFRGSGSLFDSMLLPGETTDLERR